MRNRVEKLFCVCVWGVTQSMVGSNILSSPPHLTMSPLSIGRVVFSFQILRNKQTVNEQEAQGQVLFSANVLFTD